MHHDLDTYEISKFGAPRWTPDGGDHGVDHVLPQHGCRLWLALSATSSSFGVCPVPPSPCDGAHSRRVAASPPSPMSSLSFALGYGCHACWSAPTLAIDHCPVQAIEPDDDVLIFDDSSDCILVIYSV